MIYNYEEIHSRVTAGYVKARSEERSTFAQIEFELNVEDKLRELSFELYLRQWSPLPLDWFVLTEPSVREVFAPQFRDRIVSHVLFDILMPIYDRLFIYDSYSCRVGKGTLFGIDRFEHHLRSVTNNYTRDAYVLNLDISGYFMSIDRQILYNLIHAEIVKYAQFHTDFDLDFTEYLVQTFLFRDPLAGCIYHGNPCLKKLVQPNKSLFGQPAGVGLPIGDVINQLNSNIYLNLFDHFCKRYLKISGYGRYVDDSRSVHNSLQYLEECKERSAEFLYERLHLNLNKNKSNITSAYEANTFLGATIMPYYKTANEKTIQRFERYMKELNRRIGAHEPIDQRYELSRINSALGHLAHFSSAKVMREVIQKSVETRRVFGFTSDNKKAIILTPNNYEVPIFPAAA